MLLPATRAFSTLLLYLVACPAGWQPLESGLAGQDRTLLALACVKGPQLLGLKLPDAKTFGSLVSSNAWSLPAAGHPSTALPYPLGAPQPAEPSVLG